MHHVRDEVIKARRAIGLSADIYEGVNGGITRGLPIVCKCIHCGTLFSSLSHNLADLLYINRGDCGQTWQHSPPLSQDRET